MDKVYSHLKGKMRRILRHTSIRVCMISRLSFFIWQNLATSFAICDIMHMGWQHLCLFIFSFFKRLYCHLCYFDKTGSKKWYFYLFSHCGFILETSRIMTPNFSVIFCTYLAPITDIVTCWMRLKYRVIIHDLIGSMTTRHDVYTY